MTPDSTRKLVEALWRIYRRPQPPAPPEGAANLPWDDPGFGERMLREHLDQSHGAASRQQGEILRIVDWLWDKLSLREGSLVLDVTCGPGLYAVELALRGCRVHGVDFSPASIGYARRLAADEGMAECCTFELADVRAMGVPAGRFDAALFLYGQLAVFSVDEAADLLRRCAAALRPGGRLAVELLDFERVDRQDSAWWYTGDAGLWGDFPYLHLGERRWYPERDLSLERYYILNLETGGLDEYALSDQAYPVERAAGMLRGAGFAAVQVYPAWGGLELYDAGEWVVYVGEKSVSTP
jgi:SAM-dependent methyltransferase